MKSRHNRLWIVRVKITAFDLYGKILDVWKSENLLMNVGLNMVRDGLKDAAFDTKIKFLAWGSGNTAPAVGQTQLVSETDRQGLTSWTAGGVGELITVVYINPATAVAPPNIEELGWFAGVGAVDAPNAGIMVGRILYSRAKTNLESLQIERTDTISEVI